VGYPEGAIPNGIEPAERSVVWRWHSSDICFNSNDPATGPAGQLKKRDQLHFRKDHQMKNINLNLMIALGVLILAVLLPTQNSDAEEGSCYLKAHESDVFVIVYDLDPDGNMGPKIWEGRINQGQTAKITTPHGMFRYDYNAEPDVDQPLSGGFDRYCNNLETILVP
jgi:hypothetical protein